MPRDSFGREIDYLRISVIDACNLRCTYCMPLQGARFLPKDDLLTAEEFGQVVDAAVSIGFRKFRLTGGEPTLRRDLEDIIRRIKSVEGAGELSMTTNGILLPDLAADLAAAGLDRINLHLDTLDEQRLHQIMRRHDLAKAWDGIRAAEDAGLAPIKMNTVVVAGENEHDVVELAKLTLEHDWHIRFIELMPLGSGPESTYSRDKYVSNQTTSDRIEAALGKFEPLVNAHPSDESRNFRLPGGKGVVGFISPVSAPFCDACNRMRLTADGQFHLCLLKNDRLDVRKALREGGGLDEVRSVLQRAVSLKPVGHELKDGRSNTALAMHQIGG